MRAPPAKRARVAAAPVSPVEQTPLADYWLADAASASKRDAAAGTKVWDDATFTDGEDDAPAPRRAQRSGGARRRVRQLLEGLEEGVLGPHSLVKCEA